MTLIINPGGSDDKQSIALVTAKRRHIRNEQRREKAPETMAAAKKLVLEGHAGRELRSLASTYNCIGMVFANRRTCIEPEEVPMILEDDGYRPVDGEADVKPGDILIYEDDGAITHVAVVLSNQPDVKNGRWHIRVLSQWGAHGEYIHAHDDVDFRLGKPVRFYSERRMA